MKAAYRRAGQSNAGRGGGVALGLLLLVCAGCKPAAPLSLPSPPPRPTAPPVVRPASSAGWKLTSSAFANGTRIPVKYTQDGAGVSPPLTWTISPAAAKELVLICDDPDAPQGTFTHWVVYGLDPGVTVLPEGLPAMPVVAEPGLKQGMNSAHHLGYIGPAPPAGKVHHYHFQLYAVSAKLNLTASMARDDVLMAMEGKIAGKAELVGTYSR
jgi:Raf kinase inhibitor-like YbhB/YbcL family protein